VQLTDFQWIGCYEHKEPLASRDRRHYKASICATRPAGLHTLKGENLCEPRLK